MSRKEIDRLSTIQKLQSKQISQIEAARQLGLSTRQVRRLAHKLIDNGAIGLTSKRRGKPSNHKLDNALKNKAIELIKL